MSILPPRRSSKILVILAICMALQMTGFYMILPLFARRFESFGAGVQALAGSDTAYALTGIFAAPLIGILADRFGRRPIFLISISAFVLAFSGYLVASASWMLILFRGLAGAFTAGLFTVMTSIVGDLVDEKRRAQWYGIVMGGASVGFIIGPPSGGWLYDRYGYVVPFATAIFMALGALLLAALLIPESRSSTANPAHKNLSWMHWVREVSSPRAFYLVLAITFGVMFAYAFFGPQFMFYAYDDLAWSSSQMGFALSAYGVAFVIGEFTLGRLSDRLGRKPVLVLGLALFAAQFLGMVIFRDLTWIVLSFVLAGLGNALYDPALSAFILDITPAEHTAGMIGLKTTAASLGNMLGPGLLMLVSVWITPQIVFVIATVLVVVLTLVSGVALRIPAHSKAFQPVLNLTIEQ